MTTKKQKAANRRNAKKSTGPKTAEGKARSSQNRMTHGLLSRQVLLKEEDPDRFLEVSGMMWSELRPVGEMETYLAARITSGIWRMNRVVRIEAQLFNDSPVREVEPEIPLGQLFKVISGNGSGAFGNLHRYETTIDRGIQRAYGLLRTVQAERRREEEAEESARRKVERDEAVFEAIRTRHLPESARAAITGRREPAAAPPQPEFPFEPIAARSQPGSGTAGSTQSRQGAKAQGGEIPSPAPEAPPFAAVTPMAGGEHPLSGGAHPSTESSLPLAGGGIGEGVAPERDEVATEAPPQGGGNGRKRKIPLEPIVAQAQADSRLTGDNGTNPAGVGR